MLIDYIISVFKYALDGLFIGCVLGSGFAFKIHHRTRRESGNEHKIEISLPLGFGLMIAAAVLLIIILSTQKSIQN
jgi:TctA family transporter